MATTDVRVVEHSRALDAGTLCEAFQITAAERPDQPAVRAPGGERELTFGRLSERVRRIAAGLARLGVGRGDTVALMMVNRPEFYAADLAAMHLGAIPFSIYNTSAPEQIAYLFGNAGNRVVITEDAFLGAVRSGGFDGDVVMVDDLDALEGDPNFDFDAAWRAVEPDDVLTLIYTSGTTGPPKGVQLTHRNELAANRMFTALVPIRPGGRGVSYLPSAHIADRWSAYYLCLCSLGCTVTSVPDPREMMAALPDVRPTIWGGVPRIWEKLKAGLEAQGILDPAQLPEEVKAGLRAKLGLDACEHFIVGAAPTPVEVLEYFDALGLRILEVWGMSETSSVSTCNPPEAPVFGTCGVPLPGVELSLAEDGELLVRGEHVMAGYRGDPEKTAEAIDGGGWLHTGDVAELDAGGYLKIVDRKKELIISAGGKNMSPANIEARLKAADPLIGQAVAIGDNRPYNVALIVLDPDVRAGRSAADDDVQSAVRAGVDAANAQLSRVEQIKRWRVLDEDWLPGGDELTPTMKLKRKPIAAKYAALIEELYAP